MSTDAIMLDSPAQTPDPKPQHGNPLNTAGLSLATDSAMDIDSHTNGASVAQTTVSWDTKKWRDDVHLIQARLLHQHYLTTQHRDPLDKPLVMRPPGLSTEAEERLRKYYHEKAG
ncbi:hypothetical protein BD289DRAFT_91052 [Coniella lustricola]|uniref:Uncharacterized protein n=1 Tax=Coniella lustricola TaxID=2025994 RepID=A0A2T3AH07_9PEZI|nr:hypothetical protein BD289DRAFT_91052 [Coniella lustricola]